MFLAKKGISDSADRSKQKEVVSPRSSTLFRILRTIGNSNTTVSASMLGFSMNLDFSVHLTSTYVSNRSAAAL